MRRLFTLIAVTAAVVIPCAGVSAQERRALDARDLVERYTVDAESLRSFYGVPMSQVQRGRAAEFLDKWSERLARTADATDDMRKSDLLDLALLTHHVRHAKGSLAFRNGREDETSALLPFAPALVQLEESRRALDPLTPRDAADTLVAAKAQLDELMKSVEAGSDDDAATLDPERHVAARAARLTRRVRGALKDWFKYYDGYEPDFGWWTRKPYYAVDEALGKYAEHLHKTVAGIQDGKALVGDPIGRDALLADLDREMIVYTPEELIALAKAEFAWCEAEGAKAAEDLGLAGGWAEAVEHVKGLHVEPGEMDELVAQQSRAAIEFVKSRELVTVPPLCEELWRLDMISSEGQKTLPFAAYSGNRMLVAYPTEDMDHERKVMSMRGNNRHFSRIVVPHELIPGHHLQLFMADRHNTHRRLFRTPFLVEGWALYWEMRLWELGWPRTAEDRVGMLFWRMHRCARIIVSLRFHLGDMSPEEMIDFLVQRVGLERDGATAEVRRYIGESYGPLYQCAYMIGGLQLRALHREMVEGGDMSEREFHDTVLRQNSIPIELIRLRLRGDRIDPAHRASWRFAGGR